jgi:CRISPR-associated protein Cmr4
MYQRQYGLIRTLAPLHVGASAGEEAGNLNLIFRDPFTQTGIIPGSSIRGRFRAECRSPKPSTDGGEGSSLCSHWYGSPSDAGKDEIKEGNVKFEHASLVWLPVFCPGQPIVWVSCPRLLRRYASIANPSLCGKEPKAYSGSQQLPKKLFFNLGFITIKHPVNLSPWAPSTLLNDLPTDRLLVVDDADMGLIHDMALYRQSRVKLEDNEKRVVEFFNVEALPEGCVLVFPIAIKPQDTHSWQPLESKGGELYFGGLESVGFGRCFVTLHTPISANQQAPQEAR